MTPGATVYTKSGVALVVVQQDSRDDGWWWLFDSRTGRDFRMPESEIFESPPLYDGLFREGTLDGQE